MYQNLLKNTTVALGALLVSSSLVFAAGLQGSVTALDGKGMGTVRTSDGKDHQVKVGQDFKVGSKVDCEMKNTVMECRLGAAHSAAQPAVTTPASSAVKPATTTPAPMSQTPAKPAVTSTAPAPVAPAQPAAVTPAVQPAPAQTSATAPSTTTPAPASK